MLYNPVKKGYRKVTIDNCRFKLTTKLTMDLQLILTC